MGQSKAAADYMGSRGTEEGVSGMPQAIKEHAWQRRGPMGMKRKANVGSLKKQSQTNIKRRMAQRNCSEAGGSRKGG